MSVLAELQLFKRQDVDDETLEFMSEYEAAFLRKGSVWAYRLSALLLVLFLVFLLWTCTATRNEVTRGEGQITPSLGIQPIQSEQGGIIKSIFVKEGQEVRKGDSLVQMSNIEAITEYEDLLNKRTECLLALKRLNAESQGIPLIFSFEDWQANLDMVKDQERLFTARKEKFESGNREIKANLEQKRSAVEESLLRKAQYEKSLLLLQDQERRVAPLVKRRIYPEIDYLNLRQRIIAQEGELRGIAESISRMQSEVEEESTRLAGRDSEWQAAIAAERNDYRRQLDSIEKKLTAGGYQLKISDLRAPMAGVIKKILLKEENVAQRAQTIMELLPTEDTLEINARFRPADRGFLDTGQNATIKVTAYDAAEYGVLSATVTKISPDTIEDSKGRAWYEVRLQTNSSKLVYDNQELEIKPGMTVTVDVVSGEKSIFDYLMKPILKSRIKGRAVGHKSNGTAQQ
jgi:adhesin transport system membrane fusion protein